jgi:hypothetical protein
MVGQRKDFDVVVCASLVGARAGLAWSPSRSSSVCE